MIECLFVILLADCALAPVLSAQGRDIKQATAKRKMPWT
jgi:hypothetical protein